MAFQTFREMDFPEVALSRDGQRGVLVQSIEQGCRGVSGRAFTATDAVVRLAPRGPSAQIQLRFGDQFPMFWDMPGQTQRWPEPFSEAFPEIAVMAIGEYLDDVAPPAQPGPDNYAAVIWVNDNVWSVFQRPPEEDDARLLRYIGGKFYWAHRLGATSASLGRHDAVRFGVAADDLHQVAWQSNGELWDRAQNGRYHALPRLLTDFRAGALPGQERSLVEQVQPFVDRSRYPAAAVHLDKAVGFLGSTGGDLENAAKEAVAAVESVSKVLLNMPTATLGDCVKEFRKRNLLPRETARILESLYAYRSATPGVGHGGTDLAAVSPADAHFILGVAAVAMRYLDSLWPMSNPKAAPQ
ncbi:MAG TPA: hypothetical protein VJL28_09775 [Gemmatimonadaceae bacterium]|nr:hypothetical protein [Gemmatimonadaceae bacterium]